MRMTALISSGRSHHLYFVAPLFALFFFAAFSMGNVQAQVSPPSITSSGLNTTVTQNGNIYTITGGTRPGNGPNLFHSFGDFVVPTAKVANFLNETPNLATSNILGRVTGDNPSNIFGTIQTTGFGSANLFLMNPAGIVFGPNATLNVGGSVTFTTANYLRLTEVGGTAGIFHADPASGSILTSAPIAAFGFLAPNPASIAVQGSTLTVQPGQSISLVGGNRGFTYTNPDTGSSASVPGGVTMTGGTLSAPGGQINLVSVASAGEVLYSTFNYGPNVNGTQFTSLGNVSLTGGAFVDVSAESAGTVRIRGGEFVLGNATISADTVNTTGAPAAIDINVAGDMSIANDLAPALTARTTGSGNAGTISITAGNLDAFTSSSDSLVALIDTHTSGTGTAGNVAITTGNLHATNEGFFIDTGSAGTGHGGDVSILGTNILIEGPAITTGNFRFGQLLGENVTGSAGNLTMRAADHLTIGQGATLSTEAWFAHAGNITLEAHDILITGNSFVSLDGDVGSATIKVTADRLRVDATSILNNNTVVDPGGDITINARIAELATGGVIQTSTIGDGSAGNINITATERFTLNDQGNQTVRPAGLLSNSTGDVGNFGNSGSITVITPQLQVFGGAQINTSTRSSGSAGNISVTAQSVTISGERPFEGPESLFEIGSTRASGVYTRTVGSDFCLGPCGTGGNVTITTGSLNLESGGTINSGTINNGAGGNITINSVNSISISGAMTNGTASGIYSRTVGQAPDAGSGGNIALTAGQSVSISDGASVSASSAGPGNAGNIAINAGQQFEMRNSSVKTEAAQASGGNIDIQAIDRIRLVNSTISTSVLGGAGSGGNITIDPNVVILQNSQVIAQAVQGTGGNISITTPLFLADAGSLVDASSQFGLSGTVNIQSPTSNLAGTVASLPSSLRQVQSLQTGRCAALAHSQSSSLTVAGRDILPAEPGGWSPSPFALIMEQTEPLALSSSPIAAMTASADAPVSLRRLTPAGFLTQSFAENGLTGCRA